MSRILRITQHIKSVQSMKSINISFLTIALISWVHGDLLCSINTTDIARNARHCQNSVFYAFTPYFSSDLLLLELNTTGADNPRQTQNIRIYNKAFQYLEKQTKPTTNTSTITCFNQNRHLEVQAVNCASILFVYGTWCYTCLS